jgi:hypothetical protein
MSKAKRTDKQRLDWMTKNKYTLRHRSAHDCWSCYVEGDIFINAKKTPRQAIDSAMDAKERK